jgi:ATP-dependent DNA ligase
VNRRVLDISHHNDATSCERPGHERWHDSTSHQWQICNIVIFSDAQQAIYNGEEQDAATVFEHACKLGVEGIVSKRKDSRYFSGRSPYWLKMKNPASAAARREAEEA